MKTLKKISLLALLIVFIGMPFLTHGQNTSTGSGVPNTSSGEGSVIKIGNPLKCNSAAGECTLMYLITTLLNSVVMPIAAVAVTLWIIWAGFSYILAQGKPAEIQKAHQRLLWALVGAGILLGAAGISLVVQNTINALIAH